MFIFRPMFAPDGATGEVTAGAEVTAGQGTEVASNSEQSTPEFQQDREDVRQMSTFLRDFQKRKADNPTQEPGKVADTPVVEEKAPAKETEPPAKETAPAPESTPGEVKAEPPQAYKLPDGREMTAEQIIELEKGYMMQKNYTQKTQALAEERRLLDEQKKAHEKALKLMQDYERDPIGTAQRLQEEAELKGVYEPKDPDTLALEDKQRELEAKEREIKQKEQELELQTRYSELNNRMAALEQKYGEEFDREKVIQMMRDEQIYSPELAFKAIRADQLEAKTQKQIDDLKAQLKKAKEEAVNEYVRDKTTKKPGPPPVGAGSYSGSPPIQVSRPKTFEDARKAAMARVIPPR